MMNRFLIGAAAIAFAGSALAQGMQPPTVQSPRLDMPSQNGEMGNRVQIRSEVVAKVQKHFAMLDRNRDGFIAADEMQAMRGEQMDKHMGHDGDEMAMHDGAMDNRGAMFDRLDANRDGMISRDEFAKGREMRIEREVTVNGAPGGDRHGKMNMQGMGGGMGGPMMKMADSNQDGRVSLQEMTTAALQHFDQVDTNHDGRITPEERQAMHQQMKQKHGRTTG